MYAVDFEYDGQYLSDYGFMICDFDGAGDKDVTSAGSNVTFTKVSRNYGKNYSLGGTSYDECVKTTFQICKKPDDCGKSSVDMVITNDEYRDLMRWLNRREFLKFQVFDEDDEERTTCYFDVSFNVSKIKIGGALYGLELALESNRPFGYGQELSATYTFLDVSKSYIFSDISDEIGYIYPDMTIVCNADGDLSIYNELENCTTTIKNCSYGETITISGSAQTIASTYTSHDIANDFNYEFFRIGNTINTRSNRITVSKPCQVTIRYCPVIKDVP